MFGGLQVDDGHFPPFALGEEGKVAAGFDLQGRAERERQVCPSGCRRKRQRSHLPTVARVRVRVFVFSFERSA